MIFSVNTLIKSVIIQSNLFLWAFHGQKFSFSNETTREIIFEHQCGGSNRIWDFYIPSGDNVDIRDVTHRAWFMYVSKSQVWFSKSNANEDALSTCRGEGFAKSYK